MDIFLGLRQQHSLMICLFIETNIIIAAFSSIIAYCMLS